MKWRQRIVLIFTALLACFILAVYLVETDTLGTERKTYRKDELSVGEGAKLKRGWDFYPGKLRKPNHDLPNLHRELQGKSKSADQESPDQEETQKHEDTVFQGHNWLEDLDNKQTKLLKNLIAQISTDASTVNKVLKAAYLIVNESLGANINSNLQDLNVKQTDLDQLKHFLSSNGLLKSNPQYVINSQSDNGHHSPKPKRVIVSEDELQVLLTLKPKNVKFSSRTDYKARKNPQGLFLSRTKLQSAWDGKDLSDSWQRFYTSINNLEMFPNPEKSSVVDTIARHLATEPIIGVENMDGGTQIKLLFYFKDGGKAVFKPMRVTKEKETDADIFYWRDYERASAEVAAFHLDRVLDMRRTSPCVSRIVNITSEIWQLADRSLAKTIFVSPGNNVCFYGDCKYYCDTGHPVCGKPDVIDGSLCAWLPDVRRYRTKSPWRRSYSKNRLAEWEENDRYCDKIKTKPPFNKGRRLLDATDLATFDFLMYNMDRHHHESFEEFGNSTFLINLDNGRGFGTHRTDELSILAPVYQCCVFRYSLLQKLIDFHQGPVHLGEALKKSLRTEAMQPVLIDEHFVAIDRRVNITLKAVVECIQNHGAAKVVFDDGY